MRNHRRLESAGELSDGFLVSFDSCPCRNKALGELFSLELMLHGAAYGS
jgi:hypothetical protein